MATMREAWTDERLDDMQGEMRRGFDRIDTDIRDLRVETTSRFARLETKFDARFDALQRTIVFGCIGTVGTVIGAALV